MKKEFKTLAIFALIFGMAITGQASEDKMEDNTWCCAPERKIQYSSLKNKNFQLDSLPEQTDCAPTIDYTSANRLKDGSFRAPVLQNKETDTNLMNTIKQAVQNGEFDFNPKLFS